MKAMRDRLSYANVMATLAVFIAIGGTSWAAVKISGRQIKERSLGIVQFSREAGLLDGRTAESLLVRCPTGMVPVDDTCIETQAHSPANFHSAVLECGAVENIKTPGRRLPTYQELTMALTHQEIVLAPGGELTSEVEASSAGQPLNVIYVTEPPAGWGLTPDTAAGAKSYRCVADPLN